MATEVAKAERVRRPSSSPERNGTSAPPTPRRQASQGSGPALEQLKEEGGILEGHFSYESGRHGRHYVEKCRLLERPWVTQALCGELAANLKDLNATIVAGPTTGGMLLAYQTAACLGNKTLSYFAEPSAGGSGRSFGRGFTFEAGQRTLVVDDVLTTGGSLRDTIDAVRAAGGEPVGVGVVVDRTNGAAAPNGDFEGLPFFACIALDVPSYPADKCPLCESGAPLTSK